jgi:hypothetical protein
VQELPRPNRSDFEFRGLKVDSSAAYLSMRLAYPLPIKDGAVLLTLQDAQDHILTLGAQRETRYWQHVHAMISAEMDVVSVTSQFYRALVMDGSLDLEAFEHLKQARSLGSTGRRRWHEPRHWRRRG